MGVETFSAFREISLRGVFALLFISHSWRIIASQRGQVLPLLAYLPVHRCVPDLEIMNAAFAGLDRCHPCHSTNDKSENEKRKPLDLVADFGFPPKPGIARNQKSGREIPETHGNSISNF